MFRFTIRDLLWLMVVVGLALGWLIDRNQLYEIASTPREVWRVRSEEMAKVLRDDGWEVTWDRNEIHVKRGKAQIDSFFLGLDDYAD